MAPFDTSPSSTSAEGFYITEKIEKYARDKKIFNFHAALHPCNFFETDEKKSSALLVF